MRGRLFVLCGLFVHHIGDGRRHGFAAGVVVIGCFVFGLFLLGDVVVRGRVVVAGRRWPIAPTPRSR